MSIIPFSLLLVLLYILVISFWFPDVSALGSASTVAITFRTSTICGIVAGETTQRIQCYQNGQIISVYPDVSFSEISGGETFFCGLRSGGLSVLCWDTTAPIYSTFMPRRIYYSRNVSLTDLAVGDDQVCAREANSGITRCWRGGRGGNPQFPLPGVGNLEFRTITAGKGFNCGISKNSSNVFCWGSNGTANGSEIQTQFGNLSMLTLTAGENHACGLTRTGFLICKGNNESGQLEVPKAKSPFEYSGLALGANFTCALRRRNEHVVCWGKKLFSSDSVQFELIVAGLNYVCGMSTGNLSVICWGPGWNNNSASDLPLGMVIPGPCVHSQCVCGIYPDSATLCVDSGNICRQCPMEFPIELPLSPFPSSRPPPKPSPPPPPGEMPLPIVPLSKESSSSSKLSISLGLMVAGSIGGFAGICAIVYCLWAGPCRCLNHRQANSVQPSAAADADNGRRLDSGAQKNDFYAVGARSRSSFRGIHLRHQRTESSSSMYAEKTQHFSLSQLISATNSFSIQNKIGSGSFGIVYKGKLPDGRDVAIKRGEVSTRMRKFKEKESAFESELALLSRLHHKHLVCLVGFCQENDERLLVYEYVSNGALHEHLHGRNNIGRDSSALNSWKMRIKIALDSARGIEYLHNYAVPPIIHRDIKSSNILLDTDWTAKVSDFGLSLMKPEYDQRFMSTKAVGTVGYIDPEYYVLNVLTTKSDVYGLGVVLLELLTGKKAVFRNEEDESSPIGVVEYASHAIQAGNLRTILDRRVGLPGINEIEAVETLAHIAVNCVNMEGRERPNMADIVAHLERALALLEDSPGGSFSNEAISINSE